jgi:Icc-related predicted phosphoesterase
MKIQVLSDIHNEFSELRIPITDADVVILAGDIDVKLRAIPWALKFDKPVIYVLGNHEFYKMQIEKVKDKTRGLVQNSNIHFLDDEELIIDGVRFLGGTLWTDFNLFGRSNAEFAMIDAQFNMSDFQVIRIGPSFRRLLPRDTVIFHEKTVAFLSEKLVQPYDGKTVVVTHHAPSLRSVHHRYLQDKLTPSYASNLEHLMSETVCLWIHGHVHHCNDYVLHGTRVISNPRGYQASGEPFPENNGFNPELVVEV